LKHHIRFNQFYQTAWLSSHGTVQSTLSEHEASPCNKFHTNTISSSSRACSHQNRPGATFTQEIKIAERSAAASFTSYDPNAPSEPAVSPLSTVLIAAEVNVIAEAMAAVEAHVAIEAKGAAETKAAVRAHVAAEVKAAAEANVAAETKPAVAAHVAAEANAAAEVKAAAEAKGAAEANVAVETSAAALPINLISLLLDEDGPESWSLV
jgi:hypothetical protein